MRVQRLDHYCIRTTDLDNTMRFYTEVIGFVSAPRPPFKFPGCWLYNGADTFGTSNGVVHVIGVDPNFEDPSAVTLELDFPAAEAPSAQAA